MNAVQFSKRFPIIHCCKAIECASSTHQKKVLQTSNKTFKTSIIHSQCKHHYCQGNQNVKSCSASAAFAYTPEVHGELKAVRNTLGVKVSPHWMTGCCWCVCVTNAPPCSDSSQVALQDMSTAVDLRSLFAPAGFTFVQNKPINVGSQYIPLFHPPRPR